MGQGSGVGSSLGAELLLRSGVSWWMGLLPGGGRASPDQGRAPSMRTVALGGVACIGSFLWVGLLWDKAPMGRGFSPRVGLPWEPPRNLGSRAGNSAH